MRAFLVILLSLFFGQNAFATAQYPDIIIYNGNEYSLNSNPLELFFEKNPDKRPESEISSTALWRGYIAKFEIKNNQLFLKDIKIQYIDTTEKELWKSVIEEVFPNKKDIKIEWFTGLLVIPHGKLVNYIHMGYASKYENYILLEIDKGNLKKEKTFNGVDYQKFKEKQFLAFKKTKKYEKIRNDLQKEGLDLKAIDSFLKIYVIEYTSEILTE